MYLSIYDNLYIGLYFTVLAFVFGAVFGSFLNCAAWRIAHGESFIHGRSHCPDCGHVLSAPDLVPIFSWLFLGGKCRYCKAKISARYMLTELFFGIVSVLSLLRWDLSPVYARNMVFACCLFCLSLVDLESFEIPNGCLILAAAAWFITLPFVGMEKMTVLAHILTGIGYGAIMLILTLIFDKILGKETMGGGDIKLFAVTGLYLGAAASLFSLFFSCILGLLMGAYRKKKDESALIPFGPSIALASYFMLLYGNGLVNWYVGLL